VAEVVLLDVGVHGIARQAEERGRPRDVPAGALERCLQMAAMDFRPAEARGREGRPPQRRRGARLEGQAERGRAHDLRVGDEHRALHDIHQLADIARPLMLQ
jgi:hypothetical protein